jgi:hypothetical protein
MKGVALFITAVLIAGCGGSQSRVIPSGSSSPIRATASPSSTGSTVVTTTPTNQCCADGARQAGSAGLGKSLGIPVGPPCDGPSCITFERQHDGVNAAYMYFSVRTANFQHACLTYVFKEAAAWEYLESRCEGDHLISPYVGSAVQVHVPTGCANIRATPRLGAALVGCVPNGTRAGIDDGPTFADGRLWWHLTGNGWMAHDFLLVDEQAAAHSVADDTFPKIGQAYSVCGLSGDTSKCPFTERLKTRLLQARANLCRCQNPSSDRIIGADATLVGWTAHVRMFGHWTVDLLLVRDNGELLVDDEVCAGAAPSTSIYSSLAPCSA